MTRNAVTLDPKGFLGDSFYVSSLNRLVQQQQFDDDACTAHMEILEVNTQILEKQHV